jgi:predicted nucleic acid-binding protein
LIEPADQREAAVDCYTAALVEGNETGHELFSYDTDFDQVSTIIRKEPEVFPSDENEKQAA